MRRGEYQAGRSRQLRPDGLDLGARDVTGVAQRRKIEIAKRLETGTAKLAFKLIDPLLVVVAIGYEHFIEGSVSYDGRHLPLLVTALRVLRLIYGAFAARDASAARRFSKSCSRRLPASAAAASTARRAPWRRPSRWSRSPRTLGSR